MRLVCPNCGAQYEVDDRVIPDNGRDVQCSSCGHAWYQMPAHLEAAAEPDVAEPEAMAEADDDAVAETEAEAEAEAVDETAAAGDAAAAAETPPEPAAPEPEVDASKEPAPEPAAEEAAPGTEPATDAEDAAPAGEAAAPRRDLDQSLRAILQEEAAREMEARAADKDPEAETKPDDGPGAAVEAAETPPDGVDKPSETLDDSIPDLSEADDLEREAGAMAGAAAAEAASAPRRDLFPDIEEINSTLDSHGLPEEEEFEEEEEARGGFSRGFFAVIFIAAFALALYLVAPRLADTIPALEPALTAYVGAVNGAREWLDGMIQGLTGRIDGADPS